MASEVTVARKSSVNPINTMGSSRRNSSAAALSNSSVKLKMSDLNFRESRDDEVSRDIGVDLKRWDVPNVAYTDGGRERSSYATITQYLDRPGGRVAGYEAFFDRAGAIGTARTLQEAKELLLRYINSLRG